MSDLAVSTEVVSDPYSDPYTIAFQEFLRDLIYLELIPFAIYMVPSPSYFLDKFAFFEQQVLAIAQENSNYLLSLCLTVEPQEEGVPPVVTFLNRENVTKLNLRHLHNLFKHVQNIFIICKLQNDQSAEWVTHFYETMVRPNRARIEARIQEEETPFDMDLAMKDIQDMVAPLMEDPYLQQRLRADPIGFAMEMQHDPVIQAKAGNISYIQKLVDNLPAFALHVAQKQKQHKEELIAAGKMEKTQIEQEDEAELNTMLSWITKMQHHYVPPASV